MRNRAQILIDKATPDLPIYGTPGREILSAIREAFLDETIDTKTDFKIHKFLFLGETGGIGCELRRPEDNADLVTRPFVCSLTHFKIKRGEPHFAELGKYQQKRIQRLKKQGRSGGTLRI